MAGPVSLRATGEGAALRQRRAVERLIGSKMGARMLDHKRKTRQKQVQQR
jgi:hypothetical protein